MAWKKPREKLARALAPADIVPDGDRPAGSGASGPSIRIQSCPLRVQEPEGRALVLHDRLEQGARLVVRPQPLGHLAEGGERRIDVRVPRYELPKLLFVAKGPGPEELDRLRVQMLGDALSRPSPQREDAVLQESGVDRLPHPDRPQAAPQAVVLAALDPGREGLLARRLEQTVVLEEGEDLPERLIALLGQAPGHERRESRDLVSQRPLLPNEIVDGFLDLRQELLPLLLVLLLVLLVLVPTHGDLLEAFLLGSRSPIEP